MVVAKKSSPQTTHRNLPTRSPKPGADAGRAVVVVAMCASSDGGIVSMDREFPVPQPLGRGVATRTDGQDFIEQAPGGRVERPRAVEHTPDVEADVAGHGDARPHVAGDLCPGRVR